MAAANSRGFGSTETKKRLQLLVNDAAFKPPLREGKLVLLPASSEGLSVLVPPLHFRHEV